MSNVVKPETVRVTIDGVEVDAPKGALLIRVAEEMGIAIPRFCDHPLLKPAGACRQCLVEVQGQFKPVASCTQTVTDGMVVKTQHTSEIAARAQQGVMELLLINHPLDCPMCDKGGECPLQNQAMSTGRSDSRFVEAKREYPKPINISTQVLLDRERCVLCQRCTRFSEEIAGDKFIDLMERSSAEQIGIDPSEAFNSYFSGNTVQICPVGALTGAQYRFRARPFDLVSSPSVCEHCAAGCALRTDHRRGKVMRRLAGDDAAVNEEWSCDRGRWGFNYATADDRLTTPLVRDGHGQLRSASWPEALRIAADGLRQALAAGHEAATLVGGRLTVEDAYAYAKFTRVVLGSNDIDLRARPNGGSEEADFLASVVAGATEVTYADIEKAPAVALVGLEPEDECPILFLRLRKASQNRGTKVYAVAPMATRGLAKLGAKVLLTVPGDEPTALAETGELGQPLSQPGALLFVGERLALSPGGLSAAGELARVTGARLVWVPRRAGDRGAVDAGCLPNLLPGGRLVTDPAARAELGTAWGVAPGVISGSIGRGTDAILSAAAAGALGALIVAGVDPADLADPALAEQALESVGFLISLELRESAVTRHADVVFPVAAVVEKAGTFLNWEGRLRPFHAVLETSAMPDARIIDSLARELGVELGCADIAAVRRELSRLPVSSTLRPPAPRYSPGHRPAAAAGQLVLATWRQLIDEADSLDGEKTLAGTARPAVAAMCAASASALGIAEGTVVRVATPRGSIVLPAHLAQLPEGVVWLPANSPGCAVGPTLGVSAGALVSVAPFDLRETGANGSGSPAAAGLSAASGKGEAR